METNEKWDRLFGTINSKTLDTFKDYHLRRPEIYSYFKKYAMQMHATGRSRYSAKCIMERIRWDHDIAYKESDFKISNSMTSLYVRLLIWNEPQFANFFQLKTVRGLTKFKEKSDLPDNLIEMS